MKKLAVLILLVLSAQVKAYDGASEWTTVENIYTTVTGSQPFVTFGGASLAGCYRNNGAYLPVNNVEAGQRVYSTLLSAQASGKLVKVYYNYNDVADGYDGWGL